MKRFLSAAVCLVMLLVLMPILIPTASAAGLTHFDIRLEEPVASYTPDFSPAFNTDVRIYSTVTWQEDSPGFNAKLSSSDDFRAGLAYKVEIWIRLSDGHYLATDAYGDLAAALTVNGKAISSLKINGRTSDGKINDITITCNYDPLPGSEISSVRITGIPTPVEGQMPIYSFTLGSSSYAFYDTEPIVWWDLTADRQMDSSDTFIKGHVYQLNIWLRANREGGFTFKVDQYDNPLVNVTLNSWTADKVTKAYEQEGREVIDIRYTFPACQAAHVCNPTLVPQKDPTCTATGFKAYYTCTCGKNYEDAAGKKEITDLDAYGVIPKSDHTEGKWSNNGTHHYKMCTVCREVIPGTYAAHSGGTANCLQRAECAVCGMVYGELDLEHRWGPGYDYKDASGHAWICADCKGHSEIQPHTPGPAATETTPQKCTECGYVIQPAKNHTHTLTEVAAKDPTCTAVGNIGYFICGSCGKMYSDATAQVEITGTVQIPMLQHEAADTWTNDDSYHWKLCRYCQVMLPETLQEHQADGNHCDLCGYTFIGGDHEPEPTVTEPVATPTAPQNPQQSTDQEGIPGWAIALMIGLICLGGGMVAAALILKNKKN